MESGITQEILTLFERGKEAFDRGDNELAVKLLRKFIQDCEGLPRKDQTNERQFVAYLILHHATYKLSPENDFIARAYLEKCTTMFPYRVEGWHYTMMYYLDKGNHLLATAYGQLGAAEIRKLRNAGIFRDTIDRELYMRMEPDIYTFKCLFQAAISAYYAEWYREAFNLSQEIEDRDIPKESKLQHENNIKFYQSKISDDKHAM